MSKDRFSIHQESGGPLTQEAFTIMRDGGTTANSGLVGITNRGYAEGGEPFLPETIFNTQASGDSYIRFSSGPTGVYNPRSTSAVSILGNGNTRASGVQLTYYPDCDNTVLEPCTGDDCSNDPVYKKYTLIDCETSSLVFNIYDPLGINPSDNDVVSYTDKDGNSGCGTVNTSVDSTSTNTSFISQNYGQNACSVCQGDQPDNTTVYQVTICGSSEVVILSNTTNYDLTGGPVVKFQYNSQTTCGTVDPTPLFGTPTSNIQGIVDDCNDPECGVPQGVTRYRVVDCDSPTRYLVDDDSGNTYDIGLDRVLVTIGFEQTICALIEEITTDTGPELIISQTLGEAFEDCDCEADEVEHWQFTVCEAGPYYGFSWSVYNTLEFNLSVNQEVIAQWWQPSSGPIAGFPPNGTQLNGTLIQMFGMNDRQQAIGFQRPIVSENGNCGGSTNTFNKYTIDPCDEGRALDYVTEEGSLRSNNIVVEYDAGDGVQRCGTILSSLTNQEEIANTSIIAEFGSSEDACDTCEGVFGDEFIHVAFHHYTGFTDIVYGPDGECISCPDCNDSCTTEIAWVSTNGADPNLISPGTNQSPNWIRAISTIDGAISSGTILAGPYPSAQGTVNYLLDHPPIYRTPEYANGAAYCLNKCEIFGGNTPGGGFGSLYGSSSSSDSSSVSINVNGQDNVVSDISLIRPSGEEGFDLGHISFSERGYVGVGITRMDKQVRFIPNAPLTVNYNASNVRDSGTISMRVQSEAPGYNGNYGKIYVKPYTSLGGTQAIFFKDDSGVETNLLVSAELPEQGCCDLIADYEGPSGMVFGDQYGNTYAGWYTPETRVSSSTITKNTLFGWAAGYDMSKGSPDFNTLVGYTAGSGATDLQRNTVLGSESMVNYGMGLANVILGYGNVNTTTPVLLPVDPEDEVSFPTSGIIIGTNMFVNNDPPTGILAIGHGLNPVVTGITTGNSRTFAVDEARFIVSTGDSVFSISHDFAGAKYTTLVDVKDEDSTGTTLKNNIKFNFSNSDSYTKTLFEINPYATERTNTPTYASQGFQFAELDADFRLRGAIRFQDGSSLSGVADWFELGLYGTSGVNQVTEANGLWSVLDFSELELASARSNDIRTDNTFVAVQLDGTASSNIGKMDLAELATHVSDAFVNIATNCNVIITDPTNEANLNATANSESVFMGCSVATDASGWKNSVIIGTEAGFNATTPNPTLATSTASIFLGYRAGYDCDNVDGTVFIGNSAGRNADEASDSIFIGSSAGLRSSFDNSVGIGNNALRGSNTGSSNIEIVANLLDNQRLLYNTSASNKLNIQNTIAGDTGERNLSIGDARLSPESPLEVRRDVTVHGSNPNNFIQAWYCNDSLVGAVECDGSLSGFMVEGILDGNLQPAASISLASPANLSVYYNGVDTGQTAVIINRDPNFSAAQGDYILAIKMGGEYRPVTNNTGNGAAIP